MIYFTADLHFGHKNIIQHSGRNFQSVEEMDDAIIRNWNTVVTNKDTMYLLGDVGMCSGQRLRECIYQLNGVIHLVRGNHDHGMAAYNRLRFESIQDFLEIKPPDAPRITLCHYPLLVWNESHYGSWHLHGHSHGTCPPRGKRLDVGVDPMRMTPVSLDDLHGLMQDKKITYEDYHQPRVKVLAEWTEPCVKCGHEVLCKRFENKPTVTYVEHPEGCK